MEPFFDQIVEKDQKFFSKVENLDTILYQIANELRRVRIRKQNYGLRVAAIRRVQILRQQLAYERMNLNPSNQVETMNEEVLEDLNELKELDAQEASADPQAHHHQLFPPIYHPLFKPAAHTSQQTKTQPNQLSDMLNPDTLDLLPLTLATPLTPFKSHPLSALQNLLSSHEDHIGQPTWQFIKRLLVLAFLQPRFDRAVTTQQNHLLACPFSIHQITGKILVPFDQAEQFSPDTALTVEHVLTDPSRLQPSLQLFEAFCNKHT